MAEQEPRKLELVKIVDEDLVKGLAYLLTLASNGQIHGVAFAAYKHAYRHKVGILGEYARDPHALLRPVDELVYMAKEESRRMETFEKGSIDN